MVVDFVCSWHCNVDGDPFCDRLVYGSHVRRDEGVFVVCGATVRHHDRCSIISRPGYLTVQVFSSVLLD